MTIRVSFSFIKINHRYFSIVSNNYVIFLIFDSLIETLQVFTELPRMGFTIS